MTETLDLYGKDLTHERLKDGYQTHDAYDGQGDTRIVKALMFPIHIRAANPMYPDAEVVRERLLTRGDKVTVEELGLIALEKGERLGAFFTDAELKAGVPGLPAPVKVSSEELATGGNLSEQGAHELVAYLNGDGADGAPTIPEIVEKVGTDKELAKRLIDAENARDKDHPRVSLIEKLQKIAEGE